MHGAAFANYAVEDCDMIIAVGSRFDDRVAGKVKSSHRKHDTSRIWTLTPRNSASESMEPRGRRGPDAARSFRSGQELKFRKDYKSWVAHAQSLKKNHAMSYKKRPIPSSRNT